MSTTLHPLLQQFLDWFKNTKARSDASINAYRFDLNDFITRTNFNPQTINRTTIKDYIDSLAARNYNPRSICRKGTVIKTFIKYLNTLGLAPLIPITSILPRVVIVPKTNILSEAELNNLNEKASTREKLVIAILYDLDIKLSKIVQLMLSDVEKLKYYNKIDPLLTAYLTERKSGRSDWLIVNKFGVAITTRSLRRHLDNLGAKVGLTNTTYLASTIRRTGRIHRLKTDEPKLEDPII